MFLSNLKNEQKEAFMTLAYEIIKSDAILDEREKDMMKQYKMEMNLPITFDETKGEMEHAIMTFKSESDVLKKQIVFELVALANVDREYALSEVTLIENICMELGLDKMFQEKCKPYVSELLLIYEKIGLLLTE